MRTPPFLSEQDGTWLGGADKVLITGYSYMKYHIDNADPSKGPTFKKIKEFGQILLDNCAWKYTGFLLAVLMQQNR